MKRNPRRAYDREGREIAPPTIGSLREQGETTAAVPCMGERRTIQDLFNAGIITNADLSAAADAYLGDQRARLLRIANGTGSTSPQRWRPAIMPAPC
jgi:hypothetical protein